MFEGRLLGDRKNVPEVIQFSKIGVRVDPNADR